MFSNVSTFPKTERGNITRNLPFSRALLAIFRASRVRRIRFVLSRVTDIGNVTFNIVLFCCSGIVFAPLVCRKCHKRRAERREIVAEIVETEEKYGRDLDIIAEEFYRPMLVAGLLNADQLASVFLNVAELKEHSAALSLKLRDAYEIAMEQGDDDLLTVNIGRLFLEASPSMLHAFQSYCTRQVPFGVTGIWGGGE